jgi:hypothetical protein
MSLLRRMKDGALVAGGGAGAAALIGGKVWVGAKGSIVASSPGYPARNRRTSSIIGEAR